MGISWSNRRRNNFLPNPPLITSYTSDISPVPPPPPLPPPPPNYNAPPPYPAPPYPPPNSYPTPPPQPSHPYYYQYSGGGYNTCGYMGPPMVGRGSNYQQQQQPYYGNQSNGWQGIQPFVAPPLRPPPPVPLNVENRMAKKIRNDVNVHKDTIKIGVDENNPECYLVSFTFDALVDGSITIFYFAKEEADCRFTPLYPEAYLPVRIPFHKGLGQKFSQPSGTGIDLGFFDMDDLSEPSTEDVFPLVIFAEACSSSLPTDVHFGQHPPISSNAQITQAILENNNGRAFQVKVAKQILWVNQVRYELRDIYGIGNSSEAGFDSNDPGHCVICMSEPKDTAVLPCRHMCMCAECAKTLRLRTNKCPICRQPIEELLAIKVNGSDE